MKLTSTAFQNNKIDLNFGKFAQESYMVDGIPSVSFDVQWELENIKSNYVHLIFVDFDAIGAMGKPFIHWTVANMDKNQFPNGLPLNASLNLSNQLQQGFNSLIGSKSDNNGHNITDVNVVRNPLYWQDYNWYIGPMPPNEDHLYTLFVFTTENKINVNDAFNPGELFKVLFNEPEKVIESNKLQGIYPVSLNK